VKTKCLNARNSLVVGWTDPEGSRPHLGALLLAYYTSEGKLIYAGRAGTGIISCPLAAAELVAEVTFLTWTDDGLLRQVVDQGLREDKPAREVMRPACERLPSPADSRGNSVTPNIAADRQRKECVD
jgi:ATP-dependent DNA ligase